MLARPREGFKRAAGGAGSARNGGVGGPVGADGLGQQVVGPDPAGEPLAAGVEPPEVHVTGQGLDLLAVEEEAHAEDLGEVQRQREGHGLDGRPLLPGAGLDAALREAQIDPAASVGQEIDLAQSETGGKGW